MTAFVARRSLELDEKVTAPGYSPISSAESLLGLVEGERITARDLLYGLLLASGNDAAEALAIASQGSVGAFVAKMNKTARRLGLDDTHYANPIGLDDPGNYSSARDLVTLAAKLAEDRAFRKIFDSPSATLTSGAETRTIQNRNNLVQTTPFVDGVKTGYTLDAGNVLVSSATRDGIQLFAAVLGEPTESGRDADSLALLEYGFSLYREKQVVKRRQRFATASVVDQDLTLPIVAAEPVELVLRRGQDVSMKVTAPRQVEGPVAANERIGRARRQRRRRIARPGAAAGGERDPRRLAWRSRRRGDPGAVDPRLAADHGCNRRDRDRRRARPRGRALETELTGSACRSGSLRDGEGECWVS